MPKRNCQRCREPAHHALRCVRVGALRVGAQRHCGHPSHQVEPNNPVGMDGENERPVVVNASLSHGRQRPKMPLAHLLGSQVAAGEAEGTDTMVDERLLLGRPSTNLRVLQESCPTTCPDQFEPLDVLNVFVCGDAVLLRKRDQPEPSCSQSLRNLPAPQAPIKEEIRQPDGMQRVPRPLDPPLVRQSPRLGRGEALRPRISKGRRQRAHGHEGRLAARNRTWGRR